MFESYSDEPVFNVKAVVGQSEVSASTLRAWERRYGVPTPPRNTNGYRLYSARDIAVIRWLKTQVDAGMSISQAVNLLHMEQESGSAPDDSKPAPQVASHIDVAEGARSYGQLHDELIQHVLRFDEDGVERVLGEGFSLYPVEDVCLRLLQPAMVTIGEGWHRGEISISAEHFITNIIRRKLLALINASAAPTRRERIVIGCAPEEFHEIGILLMALFLRRRGLPVVYLGQNVGMNRLEEMLENVQPAMLILSASTLQAAAHLLEVTEHIVTHAAYPVTVAYGGRAFIYPAVLCTRIPATYLGDDLLDGVAKVLTLLDQPVNPDMSGIDLSAANRETARNFSAHLPVIILQVTQEVMKNHAEVDPAVYQDLYNYHRQVAEALATALRFGEPELLHYLVIDDCHLPADMTWVQHAVPEHFHHVISSVMPDVAAHHMKPYLAALADSVGNVA